MGIAIVEAALARGARVTLIAGRLEVPVPPGVSAVTAESTAAMRDAVVEAVFLGRADALVMAAAVADFRPAHAATDQAHPRRRPEHRARAHRGHPRRGRRAGRLARSPPRHRRLRRRDREPRPGPREAPPQGRRPPGRQRRRRGRARGSAPRPTGSRSWAPTGRATTCRCCPSARSPTGCWTASRSLLDERGTAPDERGTTLDERGTPAQTGPMSTETLADERPDRVRPPPLRRRHRQALRRRRPDRDDHRVRLPYRCAGRRGRRPADPRRRLAGPGDAGLRHHRARDDGRDAPPHQGRGPGHEARADRRRHAVPVLLDARRRRAQRRPLPPRGRHAGGQGGGRRPQRAHHRRDREGRASP